MTMLDQLKSDLKQSRISRNTFESDTLRTLIGDIELALTRANSESADNVVKYTITSFVKNAKICSDKANDASIKEAKSAEIEIYSKYMPKQMTISELTEIITSAFGDSLEAKQKGAVMGYLKSNFSGQYDGASAAQVVTGLIKT